MTDLLSYLVASDVDQMELLAAGNHRDTGVLAKLTAHQLRKLVPATEGVKGLPFDALLRLARFPVERALLVKSGAPQHKLELFDVRAAQFTSTLINNFLQTQETNAQRRADKMTEATVVDTIVANAPDATPAKPKKPAGSKAGAKDAPAKAAKAPAKAKKVTAEEVAPAKATKAEKKPQSLPKTSTGVRIHPEMAITINAAENPYRPGTKAALTYDLFVRVGKLKNNTVAKVQELAAATPENFDLGYLRYSSRDGHISLA